MKNRTDIEKFKLDVAFYFAELLNKPLVRPHHVYFDLTHHCTHDCIMCGVIHILKGKVLPFKDVKKVIDEIKTWDRNNTLVTLTGGEPLTRSDIFEIIEYSTSLGIRTELITNGYLINKDVATRLMGSKLENIAVSLEGATQKTHDTITRVKGSFNRAVKSLKMMVAAKKKLGSGPQISVWMTIMNQNVHEIYNVANLSKRLGIDCLVYHPVVVKPEDMQNTITRSDLWPNRDKLQLLKKQISKVITYKANHGIIAFLHDPWLFVRYFENDLIKRDWKCNPFEFLSIGPDGNLQVCGDSFGSIHKSSIVEAMETKKAEEIRQRMKLCTKNCLQTCWARPDADSLRKITMHFLKKIELLPKEEQRLLLESALHEIKRHKRMLK